MEAHSGLWRKRVHEADAGATYQIVTHTWSELSHMDVMLQLDLQVPVPLQEVDCWSQNLQSPDILKSGGNTPSIKARAHTHIHTTRNSLTTGDLIDDIIKWCLTILYPLHHRPTPNWANHCTSFATLVENKLFYWLTKELNISASVLLATDDWRPTAGFTGSSEWDGGGGIVCVYGRESVWMRVMARVGWVWFLGHVMGEWLARSSMRCSHKHSSTGGLLRPAALLSDHSNQTDWLTADNLLPHRDRAQTPTAAGWGWELPALFNTVLPLP